MAIPKSHRMVNLVQDIKKWKVHLLGTFAVEESKQPSQGHLLGYS